MCDTSPLVGYGAVFAIAIAWGIGHTLWVNARDRRKARRDERKASHAYHHHTGGTARTMMEASRFLLGIAIIIFVLSAMTAIRSQIANNTAGAQLSGPEAWPSEWMGDRSAVLDGRYNAQRGKRADVPSE